MNNRIESAICVHISTFGYPLCAVTAILEASIIEMAALGTEPTPRISGSIQAAASAYSNRPVVQVGLGGVHYSGSRKG